MKKIKLIVPESWNDITVKQYQKFMQILKVQKDEHEKTMDIVSVFCNVDRKLLKKFKMKDLNKISNIITSMTKDNPSHIKMEKNIEFNNDKYGVIPNMSEMTTGEFVDLESYCEESTENLHKIMSVLYRPIVKRKGSRYQIEDYGATPIEERAELFKEEMTVGDFNGASVFFYNFATELLKFSNRYLKTLKTKTEQLKKLAN